MAVRRRAAQVALRVIWNADDDEDGGVSESDDEDAVQHIADVRHGILNNAGDNEMDSTTDDDDDEEAPVRQIVPRPQPQLRMAAQGEDVNQLTDKNGNVWSEVAPVIRRRGAENILQHVGGPTAQSNQDSIVKTFQLFFTDEMLNDIVLYSSNKLATLNLRERYELTLSSLKAYIGIMYYRGANGDTQIPIADLWGSEYSSFYRTVMSRGLFQVWTRVLRFDDPGARPQRIPVDTFAAVRDLWDQWNRNLQYYFLPTESITIDEQLVSSRTRSPHRIYNPSKPGKYGELIHWACDANYRYFIKGHPLTKRPIDPAAAEVHREENKAKSLVLYLGAPALDSGKCIVGDRFFSSVDLAKDLLNRRTTYVGTLMKNKRDIPPLLLRESPQYESNFVFSNPQKKVTLQSYQVKRNKKVLMLSTMHHDKRAQDDEKKKSDIQLYYNAKKSGVDICDKMAKEYTVRVQCRRWPLVHFHNQLDISGINAFTVYNYHYPDWSPIPMKKQRRTFLMKLAKELVMEFVTNRLANPVGLQISLVASMERFTGQQRPDQQRPGPNQQGAGDGAVPVNAGQRLRCHRCRDAGRALRRCNLTTARCSTCHEPVCGNHVAQIKCTNCVV